MRSSRFHWKMFTRLVVLQAAFVLVGLAASGLTARYFFKQRFLGQVEKQLGTTLKSLSVELTPEWCGKHADTDELRLTVIRKDGTVLCDSHSDPKTMDNHLSRPEIAAALHGQFSHAIRYSSTLSADMLYGALDLSDRGILVRGAIPLARLNKTLHLFDTSLGLVLALFALVLGGGAAWSGNDMTESLWLEREQHETLMGAISDAILAVDREGAPLFYNSRFVLLLGREKFRKRGDRLARMFEDAEILEAFNAALREGRSSTINAMPFALEGGRNYFSISVSPLRRPENEVYGAVGIFHDVTELKRVEQIRIDFVANVSHELRTPLTAIKGYTDTVLQDIDRGQPVEREFVDVIARNSARLMSLINDLLDLSSLDSSADDLHRVEVSTEEITRRVLHSLRQNFEAKSHIVDCTTDAAVVHADSRRLEQVLVNLLDNANKYTPTGGHITVSWSDSSDDVHLRVTDSGPGIPREHHDRLFERFYRVDKARSRELGGTGLGLAIVKHIMQRHGGSIGVESAQGRGTTFICRFPRMT